MAVAVCVAIVQVPPIFKVAPDDWVNPPVPARAVATVRELLLVRAIVVTVTLGIVNVPVSAWAFVVKVCSPEPPVKAGVVVIPPRNSNGEFPELFQFAPAAIVTRPVKSFAPVADEMFRVPLVPPPIVVVPVTVNAKPAAVKVVPLPVLRFPVIESPATVVVLTVPLSIKLPPIAVVPVCKVTVPLPLKVR